MVCFFIISHEDITEAVFHPGQPCDNDGYDLPEGTSPSPEGERAEDDFFPYSSCAEFELADFLF